MSQFKENKRLQLFLLNCVLFEKINTDDDILKIKFLAMFSVNLVILLKCICVLCNDISELPADSLFLPTMKKPAVEIIT